MKTESISAPHFEGYKCVGYRVPKKGEYYLLKGDLNESYGCSFVEFLIYEKILPKRHVFEETGEFRQVKRGELYLSNNGTVLHWGSQYPSLFEHKILRKVEKNR